MKKRVLLILSLTIAGAAACHPAPEAAPTATCGSTALPPVTATLPPTATAEAQGAVVLPTTLSSITPDTVDAVELLKTLEGHTDRVYGLDFSSDGRLLLSGSWDGTMRLWEAASGQETQVVDAEGDWNVFFAPDGEHVASAEGKIWDLATGSLTWSVDLPDGHATFSPDGAWMASAGFNAPVLLWDVDTRERVQTLAGHADRVFGMAFSPDGALLATGSGMGPSLSLIHI